MSLLADANLELCGHISAAKGLQTVVFAQVDFCLMATPPALANNCAYWIELRFKELGISAVHIPLSSKKLSRHAHWQAAISLTKSVGTGLHLLIGDLNTTLHGIDEKHGAVPDQKYLRELEQNQWVEAWRKTHQDSGSMEYSWYPPGSDNGFRIDQAWLSPALAPLLQAAVMDHDVRNNGLSDHSMLIVDLDLTL